VLNEEGGLIFGGFLSQFYGNLPQFPERKLKEGCEVLKKPHSVFSREMHFISKVSSLLSESLCKKAENNKPTAFFFIYSHLKLEIKSASSWAS
jgi:hypothetical protein